MNVTTVAIPGVLIIEPRQFEDERGFFVETFQLQRYRAIGIDTHFVQDNHTRSVRGVLRGLHYQIEHPQGKLCRVVRGEVFDVVVDMRRKSPTWGRWTGIILSESNGRQVYIPPGLAHGFCVLSETADFLYKCTDYYYPEHERTLVWNDPQLGIEWPIDRPILSEKDRHGLTLANAPCFECVC